MSKRKRWGGTRKGPGRRPLARDVARSERVGVMLTRAERDQLQEIADGDHLPVGTVAHHILSCALARRRTKS